MNTPKLSIRFLISIGLGFLVAHAVSANSPNFIIVFGEGSGWTSSSVQMDDLNQDSTGTFPTPNLERLADRGLRFVHGYAASPRCTPSRAALLTGRNPAELRMTFVGNGRSHADANGMINEGAPLLTPAPVLELPRDTLTIAELLKTAGYATAHFGKWHLGRLAPTRHGFDESDGANSNGGPENVDNPVLVQGPKTTDFGIDFMRRQTESNTPFYLQISHYPDQSVKRRTASSAPDIGDRELGRLLDAVDQLGLTESTYIIYTTDHGTPGRNRPLTGGKGSVWEGGLRVPFIVAGPKIPAGENPRVRVTATDLLPTLAELAGINIPAKTPLDGGSFAAVLHNPASVEVLRPRDHWVVHFPHYDHDPLGPASAIYQDNFKLIRFYESGDHHLFDVEKDPNEQDDLFKAHPKVAAKFSAKLDAYLESIDAQMPVINPVPNPDQESARSRGGNRRERPERDRRNNRDSRCGRDSGQRGNR